VATKGMYGEDIHEGKMTLMVIHSLNNGEKIDSDKLLEILKLKTLDKGLIDEAIGLIKKTNSIEFSQQVAEKLIKDGWEKIKDYIPNNKSKGALKELAEYFIKRKK